MEGMTPVSSRLIAHRQVEFQLRPFSGYDPIGASLQRYVGLQDTIGTHMNGQANIRMDPCSIIISLSRKLRRFSEQCTYISNFDCATHHLCYIWVRGE